MSKDVPGLVGAEPEGSDVMVGAAGLALATAGLITGTAASALGELAPATAARARRAARSAAALPAPRIVRVRLGRAAAAQRARERATAERLDALLRRSIGRVLSMVDLNRLLAGLDVQAIIRRVDLDEVIASIDLDAALHRVDLPGIAAEVMEELDIGAIVRESTMSIGTQSVEAMRFQGVRGDELLVAFVDRLLRRASARETGLEPGELER